MPTDNRLRLDKDKRLFPSTPKLSQQHPEQSLRANKARLRMLAFQNCELLPKSQVFQQKVVSRAKKSGKCDKQEPQLA
jgi:hypothetical protein